MKRACPTEVHWLLRIPPVRAVTLDCFALLLTIGGIDIDTDEDTSISEPRIINATNGNVVAVALSELCQWLSYRKCSCRCISKLCGSDRSEKRIVSRAVKRVVSWQADWTDLLTPPELQLKDPLCPQIIFDKMLRHRQIQFLSTCCSGKGSGSVSFLSAADLLFALILSRWMQAFAAQSHYVIDTIPATVYYLQSIRLAIRELHCPNLCSVTPDNHEGFLAHLAEKMIFPLWVDEADILAPLDRPFRFACRLDNKTCSAVSGVDDAGRLESMAGELIRLVCWKSVLVAIHGDSERGVDSSGSTGEKGTELENCTCLSCSRGTLFPVVSPESTKLSEDFWTSMHLPAGREERKQRQIQFMLTQACELLPPDGTAVEFCAGGGYVGIALAALRPDVTVILTDMNSVSLSFARMRVDELGLSNVSFRRCELGEIENSLGVPGVSAIGAFDVGLALHACGAASDAVLRICTQRRASFVVCPCCYGFIQHAIMMQIHKPQPSALAVIADQVTLNPQRDEAIPPSDCGSTDYSIHGKYPQSRAFVDAGWKAEWFASMCAKADRTFWTHDDRHAVHDSFGRHAMRVIDTDRLLNAREKGYIVKVVGMTARNSSPKNHILVGGYETARNMTAV